MRISFLATIAPLVVIAFGLITRGAVNAESPAPGGWEKVAVTDPDLVSAAEFAVAARQHETPASDGGPPARLELVAILSAEQQVVAGMNYRLRLRVKQDETTQDAEAVVWWQAWRKPDAYQLTSWAWQAADPTGGPEGGRPGGGRGDHGQTRPPAGRGQWSDPRFIEDRNWFHFLLDNRAKIRRTVARTDRGVDTTTESDDPEVTAGIQTHVAAMHARVKEGRGIHLRDPLFREVFRHADKISIEITDTDKGVRVVEASDDPYVASLIQAHAEVVSLFIKHGHEEVRKNHAVPPRPE